MSLFGIVQGISLPWVLSVWDDSIEEWSQASDNLTEEKGHKQTVWVRGSDSEPKVIICGMDLMERSH